MDILTSKHFSDNAASTRKNSQGSDDNGSGVQKKRRKRISLTCTSCKQRKVKCDQGKPCSSCVKKRIPAHLCIYEDSPFLPTVDSSNPVVSIAVLKDENAKLKAELEELRKWKEIVSGEPVPGHQHGSTCELASPSNPKLQLFENVALKANKIIYFGPTSWRSLLDKEGSYSGLVKSAKRYVSNIKREWKIEKQLDSVPYEVYKDVYVGSPQKLLENLADFLPEYETIKHYLIKFLEGYWNSKIPIIESKQLLKDFHQLFEKNDDGSFHFKIRNKSIDYANIALILVVLKFMVMTHNSFHKSSNYDTRDHLVRYAERLLEYSKYMTKPTIPALQTMILLRQFMSINPLNGDGGDSSEGSLTLKTAINMAILMGLHKNIDDLFDKSSSSTRSTLKNIWRHLMYQDAMLSFHLGVPLAVEDNFIADSYSDHLNGDDGDDDLQVVMTGFIRQAVKALTKSEGCTQNDLLNIIEKMEAYNNGELLKVSYTVKDISDAEFLVRNYQNLIKIELKCFALFTLHVLYDVLYHGVEDNNPNKDIFYSGTMKFGTLCATHFIEVMLRSNKLCVDNVEKEDTLFKIVEMSHSIVGLSKIIFIKIFCAICTFEVIRLFEDDLKSTHPKKFTFTMDITDFESLNPRDTKNYLNSSFKSPAFLHGLMTLACKYMLKMKNESFESVFNLNFCLFIVLALFKYFEKFIDQKLSKEKETSSLNKIQTTLKYENEDQEFPNSQVNTQNQSKSFDSTLQYFPSNDSLAPPQAPTTNTVYTPASFSGSTTSSIHEGKITPTSTTEFNNNQGIPTQSYITGDYPNMTDPIDEMFKDVFKEDNLFSMQLDTSFNWDLSDFMVGGTGMFYEDKSQSQGQAQNQNQNQNQGNVYGAPNNNNRY